MTNNKVYGILIILVSYNTSSALDIRGATNGRWFTLLEKNSLIKIRKDIERCIDKKVILKANKGRKRTVTREGILESAYPNLFVVRISNEYESERRVSYTYTDVLTGTVQVTVRSESKQQEKIS